MTNTRNPMTTIPLPTEADVEREHLTVGALSDFLYPKPYFTVDHARPIQWDDAMYARGVETRGRFVWGYVGDNDISGRPLPLTVEALLDLAAVASHLG